MASNLKVDIVRPTATNGSLALKGDSGGSATTNGITVNSSGNTAITGQLDVDNLRLNGNTISSTNSDITLTPSAGGGVNVEGSNSGGSVTLKVFNNTTNLTGSKTQILMPVYNGTSGFSITSDSNATDGYNAFLTTGQTDGDLIFGSGAGTERMRIDSSGDIRADTFKNLDGTGAPNFPNGHTVGAGTASTPSISNTDDTNTGIYFPAADTIAASTGGSERMRIDNSGNVQFTGSLTAGTIGSDVVFPAGTYKNFVQVTNSTQIQQTSTSFVDTGISAATINLSSTSSKVLVFVKCHLDTIYDTCIVTVYSNASGTYSNIITTGSNLSMLRLVSSSARVISTLSGFFLHSPGVSGNVSYKIYLRSGGGGNAIIQGAFETTCLGLAEVL